MVEKETKLAELIKGEDTSYSDDALFNITSFGTDLMFRELITMYDEGDLEKPELQRKYVWTKNEASRFIDSILLGLPLPSIFLAKTKDEKRLIVDGYQRIMTVYDYVTGIFSGDGKIFKLSNSENINPRWRGKAFKELSNDEQRKIKMAPIHAIIFEQKYPENDTGMYQIFERINTSGRALKPQEIRNCVYHGKFNSLLIELNRFPVWREILGSEIEDARMGDIELILRFFAFCDFKYMRSTEIKQINLVKYLNEYMNKFYDIDDGKIAFFTERFSKTQTFLYQTIGTNLFRTAKSKNDHLVFANKVNPVIFDSVCAATVFAMEKHLHIPEQQQLYNNYISLISDNEEFSSVTKVRTTNVENIVRRINIATSVLYGVEYEW